MAVDELIEKFHREVVSGFGGKIIPELKGDKVMCPNVVRYTDYSWEENNKISWSNLHKLNNFCAGIYFGLFGQLNGSYTHIKEFNPENVDFSKYYELTVGGAAMIKFYKNGRVDVKFKERKFAERLFTELRLDKLKTE